VLAKEQQLGGDCGNATRKSSHHIRQREKTDVPPSKRREGHKKNTRDAIKKNQKKTSKKERNVGGDTTWNKRRKCPTDKNTIEDTYFASRRELVVDSARRG